MEAMFNLAVVQTGPVAIRLFALFGFIMLMLFAYNLLFKGNITLIFIFPAQLLVPFASVAYFVSFFYAAYLSGAYGAYYGVVFSGGGFSLSYIAAIVLQKSYERVVKGDPRPYDKGLIIICGLLTFAFGIYLMWALMGYNFFYAVYDFFLTIFQWLGLYTPVAPGGYPGRGGIELLLLLVLKKDFLSFIKYHIGEKRWPSLKSLKKNLMP